jgi:DMSO/TMAO reductase YedYZ molybdopterin-dependent catalytic subunit
MPDHHATPLTPLPAGQRELGEFPRFGLGKFARFYVSDAQPTTFEIRGDVARNIVFDMQSSPLPGVTDQISDFHCVTTWSVRGLRWSGIRFVDFYRQFVVSQAGPRPGAEHVVFRGLDGYACSLPLEDLLHPEVLLADHLNGARLGAEHGAPLRLVAPAHYGYKSVKHICAIEFWRDRRAYRFPWPYPSFMDHPRARVALEERGKGMPSWLLRLVYRWLIPSTIRRFRRAIELRRATAQNVAGPQDPLA